LYGSQAVRSGDVKQLGGQVHSEHLRRRLSMAEGSTGETGSGCDVDDYGMVRHRRRGHGCLGEPAVHDSLVVVGSAGIEHRCDLSATWRPTHNCHRSMAAPPGP
jgi:hypothetical protein